jgi:hypothetical protein
MTHQSKVLIPDFFGDGDPLYANQLGWDEVEKREAKSSVSKKIFNFYIEELGRNMVFYYLGDGNFYGIHSEMCPTPVFRFKKLEAKYKYDELGEQDTHDFRDGEILYWVDKDQDVWDVVKIAGKSLEEILQNSYIVNIN